MLKRLNEMVYSLDQLDQATTNFQQTILVCMQWSPSAAAAPVDLILRLVGSNVGKFAIRSIGQGYYALSFTSVENRNLALNYVLFNKRDSDEPIIETKNVWQRANKDQNIFFRSFSDSDPFNIFEDFHPEWKETDDGKEISSKAVTYNSTKPLNATELEDENKMEEIIITNDNVNKTTSKVKANIKSKKISELIDKWESLANENENKESKEEKLATWYERARSYSRETTLIFPLPRNSQLLLHPFPRSENCITAPVI